MLKRTLYFGNPYYLKSRNEQLIVCSRETDDERSMPIEDLGFVIFDHPQISVSHVVIQRLLSENVAVIYCDQKHMPTGLLLPLDSHHIQHQRFKIQSDASQALKNGLWKQIVQAKLGNQAILLEHNQYNADPIKRWKKEVMTDDKTNREALAAKYYWKYLFSTLADDFVRERYGAYPNNLLNYGYAILRAIVARSLSGSGLLSTLGLHHHNKYNAFCLADDMMEPYRPFVDALVVDIMHAAEEPVENLKTEHKQALLQVSTVDTTIGGNTSPLMIAVQKSCTSLVKCLGGTSKKLKFAQLPRYVHAF
jgi:CRISP-associated protein Cas1